MNIIIVVLKIELFLLDAEFCLDVRRNSPDLKFPHTIWHIHLIDRSLSNIRYTLRHIPVVTKQNPFFPPHQIFVIVIILSNSVDRLA